MLKLLLKYEMKSMQRVLIPFYIVLICATVIFSIGLTNFDSINIFTPSIKDIIKIIALIIVIGIIIAINIVTFILTAMRLYKNILGTEGYLMNTIPVSIGQNIFCKLLCAFFWNSLTGILSFIAAVLFSLTYTVDGFTSAITMLPQKLYEAYQILGVELWIYIFEIIFVFILTEIAGILIIYAAICFGHLFKKKIIGSIFGSIVIKIIHIFISFFFEKIFVNQDELQSSSPIASIIQLKHNMVIHEVFISSYIDVILISIICFFICRYILKNKMNLE